MITEQIPPDPNPILPPKHKAPFPATTDRFPSSNLARTSKSTNFTKVNPDGFRVTVASYHPQRGPQSFQHEFQSRPGQPLPYGPPSSQPIPIHNGVQRHPVQPILPPGRNRSSLAQYAPKPPVEAPQQPRSPHPINAPSPPQPAAKFCADCRTIHDRAGCPKTLPGNRKPREYCGICGIAHFGVSKSCPHLANETQLRLLLDALRDSNEIPARKIEVEKYLRKQLADRVRAKKERPRP